MDGLAKMTQLYHYTGCGLDWVCLANGYTVHETDYGRGVSIDDVDGLHRLIALAVVASPRRLRGQEVQFLRAQLDLSQEGLARVMKVKRLAVARWESKPSKRIPGPADTALRLFYAAHDAGDAVAHEIARQLQELDQLRYRLDDTLRFETDDTGWHRLAA